jgi:hypothetical protein
MRSRTVRINDLEREITVLVRTRAPTLLTGPGIGVLTAAKLLGETADITRGQYPRCLIVKHESEHHTVVRRRSYRRDHNQHAASRFDGQLSSAHSSGGKLRVASERRHRFERPHAQARMNALRSIRQERSQAARFGSSAQGSDVSDTARRYV